MEAIGGYLSSDVFVLGTYLKPRLFRRIRRIERAGTIRSLCYDAGLPMRGQRARSNARIRKRNRVMLRVN